MNASFPPRGDNMEIPDRPIVSTARPPRSFGRVRLIGFGVVAAIALVALGAGLASLLGGKQSTSTQSAEAPLIRAEERPIKVTPESPGGMEVENRDIMVYERLQGKATGKPPVERLLPPPEEPMPPPVAPPPVAPSSAPAQNVTPPEAIAKGEAPSQDEVPPYSGEPEEEELPAVTETPSAPTPAGRTKPPAAAEHPQPMARPDKPQSVARPEKPQQPPSSAQQPVARTTEKAQVSTPQQVARAEPPVAKMTSDTPGGRYQVQLFAGKSADEARAAWSRYQGKNHDLLGALSPTFARADLGDKGTFYRLRAGPVGSEGDAKKLCNALAGRGVSCIIIKPNG